MNNANCTRDLSKVTNRIDLLLYVRMCFQNKDDDKTNITILNKSTATYSRKIVDTSTSTVETFVFVSVEHIGSNEIKEVLPKSSSTFSAIIYAIELNVERKARKW